MVPSRAVVPCFRALALTVSLGAGCTSLLGIDGDYTLEEDRGPIVGAGGRGAGGVDAAPPPGGAGGGAGGVATGGRASGGTTGGAGGSKSTGGAGTGGAPEAGDCPVTCVPGQKCCSRTCVPISPLWGCSPTLCEPCSVLPENAVGVCTGEDCGFECVAHYEKSDDGTRCEPISTGSGGQTGTGGSAPVCDPRECTGCAPPFYSPCCQRNGVCGCAWPGAPCFPR